MESKKISFGFSKITKRSDLVIKPVKEVKSVELIECLEGQSIKIKDKIEEVKKPLVIPIVDNAKNLLDRVRAATAKRIKPEIKEEIDEVPNTELTLNELAARELIREAQKLDSIKTESKIYSLPVNEDKFVAEGEIEPTLDDYENVPISDYGMAMLRGMGWKEGMGIGKTQSKKNVPKLPELRPKGLGLGANKMVNANKPPPAVNKDGKALQLVKGACAKIIAGNHQGQYCQVQGLDDENCRIIVKTALTYNILTLNEFLVVPVTAEEYALGSKVLNNAKYEEYKAISEEKLKRRDTNEGQSRSRSRSPQRRRRNSSDSEERNRERRKHRDDSSDEKKSKHKKKSKKSKSKKSKSKHRERDDYDRKKR